MLRQHRRQLALDLLQGRARVRTRQVEEHVRHLVQRVAALLQRDDRVLERRLLLVGPDRRDLSLVLGQRLLERGPIMLRGYLRERRQPMRRPPRRLERIGRGGFRLGCGLAHGVGVSWCWRAPTI